MSTNPESYDFVAIGDSVIDAFIRLKTDEAKVTCDEKKEHCELSMVFGDKIPYESLTVVSAVGNSPNAAVAAARLGLRTALVTDLGKDRYGADCVATLLNEKISTDLITTHPDLKTNYHFVLWYGDDRTILIKHETYPYKLPPLKQPHWLYLSSLGEHSLPYHQEIAAYLKENPEVKLAFQPGTYQIRFGTKALADLYHRTEIFFCNKEEAQIILETKEEAISILLKLLNQLGPKIVIITDGHQGAYAYQNGETWQMPIYPDPKPPLDRTGAGDAFSSTITAMLAQGKSLEEALRYGPINSMSVVGQVGAQAGLLTPPQLEEYLAKAPAEYQARKMA